MCRMGRGTTRISGSTNGNTSQDDNHPPSTFFINYLWTTTTTMTTNLNSLIFNYFISIWKTTTTELCYLKSGFFHLMGSNRTIGIDSRLWVTPPKTRWESRAIRTYYARTPLGVPRSCVSSHLYAAFRSYRWYRSQHSIFWPLVWS